MKKIIGLMLVICTVSLAKAQTNNFESSRKVSTRGYAEREVTPDIVYISISLREYFVDGNTKKKVDIETLEKQLYDAARSEEHTSELQSRENIVCRRLLEKKNKI